VRRQSRGRARRVFIGGLVGAGGERRARGGKGASGLHPPRTGRGSAT
jgi:hypothetical protein